MIISLEQLKKLKESRDKIKLKESVLLVKKNYSQWVQGKNEIEVIKFVHEIIDLLDKYVIDKDKYLFDFVSWRIKIYFEIPLVKELDILLKNNTSKDKGVENFFLSIHSGTYKLIPLNLTEIQ
ncbi:MAG: hypothetical protein ABIN36_12360 [Ferruginibacter sp.]